MGHAIDHQRFLALLSARLPEVAAVLDERARGLLHAEMGAFARATNAAIRAGDVATVRRHFQLADEIFRDAAPEVGNALSVSYLDDLALCGRSARRIGARRLLSPRLSRTLDALEGDREPFEKLE